MPNRSFLHGASVLLAASLTTRILSFVYRIYLSRLIGAEGMGLYSMIWPVVGLALTFVTAGLPVAMSKLVAEAVVQRDRVRVERILRLSSLVIAIMSVVMTLLLWFLRHLIQQVWLTDPRAYLTYIAMIPIVTVIAISSIYRGYFQGLQDMTPVSWAWIVETIVRVIVVYFLAGYFIQYGFAYAAAAAMAGTVIGEVAGLVFLIVQYRRRGRLSVVLADASARSFETERQTLFAIGEIAVPVTLSRFIGTLLGAAEPVLITRALLLAGFLVGATTKMYGEFSSMAIPLFTFPTVITWSLAVNLVPSVSEAVADNDKERVRRRMAQSWRTTALVAFPATVVLTLLATPICRLLYHDAQVGPILAVLSPCGFLYYLQGPLTGILQGLNRAGTSMMISVGGGLLRLFLMFILASQPHIGILGVAWAFTLSTILTTAAYITFVGHWIGFAIRIEDTIRIAVAALLMLVVMEGMTRHAMLLSGGQVLASLGAGLLVYFALCCSFRVITSRMMLRIPRFGPWLASFVRAFPFAI